MPILPLLLALNVKNKNPQLFMKKTLVFFIAIIADQVTKIFAKSHLIGSGHGIIAEKISCNYFIAWSIPLQGYLFWIIWLGVMTILFFFTLKVKNNLAIIFILAGATGNFIDRIRYNCVIDFIQIGSFPVFNLADIMITVGVLIFAVQLFREKEKTNLPK